MSLDLVDLDAETRTHMLAELERDIRGETLYISRYLSETGQDRYPLLLREAIESGDDGTLAFALASEPGLFVSKYEKRKPKGGFTLASVPVTAPQTLAEGEYNRFYLRAICLRAIDSEYDDIEVYRARESQNPRTASLAMVGARLNAASVLADLRANPGVDTALGLPPGPNSGLSGRLLG